MTEEELKKLKDYPSRTIREDLYDMIYWHCPFCWKDVSPFDTECTCGQKLIPSA